MRYKFKLNGVLSTDSYATRDAAMAAGLIKAGVIAGLSTVNVDIGEANHTPGPWWVDDFGTGDVRVGADPSKGMGPPICDSRTFICKMYQEDERGIDAKANARLIAAAPELLEALQKMLNDNSFYFPEGNPWGDAARAAIAKATGK